MNDITELREILFQTMRALKNQDSDMDIERAKVIADTAQTIINSAKVEVDFVRAAGGTGSGFIPLSGPIPPASELTATGTKTVVGGVTTHRMR